MSNPDEIRRDIQRTRAELSDNVNALGDRSNPNNIARSQVDKVKDGAQNLKERLFGSDHDPYDNGAAGDLGDRAGEVADDARQAVEQAPQQLKRRTQGSPFALGLIAAGLGAVAGSLIPVSRTERQYAEQVKDAAQPAVEELKEMANEAKDNLQPKAEQAAQEVKQVAQTGAENVKAEGQAATDTVRGEAESARDHVKAEGQNAVDDTKKDADQTRNKF